MKRFTWDPLVPALSSLLFVSGRAPEQQPPCRMDVVTCNYGALYTGTMSWSKLLVLQQQTATSSNLVRRTETVNVTVTRGEAVCSGTLVEDRATTGDDPTRGKLRATILGKALFAVEFGKSNGMDYFLVTVACPSEAGTDSTQNLKSLLWSGNTIESTLPELDGREMESDKQPATSIGMNLIGTITYPHPEVDPVNGVSGTVTVKWDLKRS